MRKRASRPRPRFFSVLLLACQEASALAPRHSRVLCSLAAGAGEPDTCIEVRPLVASDVWATSGLLADAFSLDVNPVQRALIRLEHLNALSSRRGLTVMAVAVATAEGGGRFRTMGWVGYGWVGLEPCPAGFELLGGYGMDGYRSSL